MICHRKNCKQFIFKFLKARIEIVIFHLQKSFYEKQTKTIDPLALLAVTS